MFAATEWLFIIDAAFRPLPLAAFSFSGTMVGFCSSFSVMFWLLLLLLLIFACCFLYSEEGG